MNILRFFESFRTCETERAPNARQNNGFFCHILPNFYRPGLTPPPGKQFFMDFYHLDQTESTRYGIIKKVAEIKKSLRKERLL